MNSRRVACNNKMSKDHILQHTIKDEKILSLILCRICRTEQTDDCMNNLLTSSHNGLHFVDMLQDCLQRTIFKDNGIPLAICVECTSNLIIAYNFHLLCNASEKKFKEMLGYHLEPDASEQKLEVIINETDGDMKQSYFIDCAAIDTNCDEIDDSGRRVTETNLLMEQQTELKLNKPRTSRYECYLCRDAFGRIIQLRQHFTSCHFTDDMLWKCSDCQKRFAQRKNLMKHLYKHTSTSCEYCPEKFATLRDLQQHSQRTHKDELILHQCDRCPRKFVLNAQLRIHLHSHNTSQRYNCNVCNDTFATEMQLKGHIRSVHTQYLCSECGKTFKNNSLLTSHQKVHNSDKPFVCAKCPSRFKWKVALTYHMTIHQQERKHVCETCGMSFTTRSAMKGHMSESFVCFCFFTVNSRLDTSAVVLFDFYFQEYTPVNGRSPATSVRNDFTEART